MTQKRSFRDKTIVVTGAASGIGLAASRRFALAGANLAMLDEDDNSLAANAALLSGDGYSTLAIPCDVTLQHSCKEAIDRVIDHYGGVDLLFNNAGITQRGAFVDTRIDVFRKVMEVNFFGSLYCTKAAIDSIIERKGMVVANESIAGIAPLLGRTGYSASKHAMHGLFTSLRSEISGMGVHVMIVCPGFVKTNLQSRAIGPNGGITTQPQSRFGMQQSVEKVAEAIYQGAIREKNQLVLSLTGKVGYWLHRFSPLLYEKIMMSKLKSELDY